MKNDLIQIRPFDAKDWDELVRNAEADQHSGVYAPTHVSIRDEKIVGYLSIGVIPCVLCWQDRKAVGPSDSLMLTGFIKATLAQYKYHLIPCDPDSPYNRLLPHAGYQQYTKPVHLYVNKPVEVK